MDASVAGPHQWVDSCGGPCPASQPEHVISKSLSVGQPVSSLTSSKSSRSLFASANLPARTHPNNPQRLQTADFPLERALILFTLIHSLNSQPPSLRSTPQAQPCPPLPLCDLDDSASATSSPPPTFDDRRARRGPFLDILHSKFPV